MAKYLLVRKDKRSPDLTADAIQRQFEGMHVSHQKEILSRIHKCLDTLDRLGRDEQIREEQRDALRDLNLLAIGVNMLKGKDPKLYEEFSRASKEELKTVWKYTLNAEGVPIIEKKVR